MLGCDETVAVDAGGKWQGRLSKDGCVDMAFETSQMQLMDRRVDLGGGAWVFGVTRLLLCCGALVVAKRQRKCHERSAGKRGRRDCRGYYCSWRRCICFNDAVWVIDVVESVLELSDAAFGCEKESANAWDMRAVADVEWLVCGMRVQ